MTVMPKIGPPSAPRGERSEFLRKPVYDARKIVGNDSVAVIVLDDQEYTLRITKQSKLLLTK